MYPGGDHIVYLGEVVEVERNDRRPLAFARGKYMVAFEHEMNFELPQEGAHLAHNDAVRLGCAALPELANRTGTAVGLAVWGNRGATIIRWELAPRAGAPELRTGVVMSPLNSATGLLFGAFLPDPMTAPVLGDALTRIGVAESDLDRVRAEHGLRLTGVRSAGIASSPEVTSRGLYGISVPVFDAAGHMILALCVVVAQADDAERIRWIESECSQCARTLSERLGYRKSEPRAA
jgi:DNA-binding IclR family transcriptional regulator